MGPRGRRGKYARRGQSSRQGNPARQRQHAVVVNLDGASSSDNEEQSPVKPFKKPKEKPEAILHITLSPDKMSRGIMSDSSDSDCGSDCLAISQSSSPRVPPHLNTSALNYSDDIFDINYSAHNHQALRGAYKELNINEGEQSQILQSSVVHIPNTCDSDDDCLIEEESGTPKRKQNNDGIIECPPSPTLFEIDKHVQRGESHQNTKRKGRRRNRTMDKAVSLQEELSKKQRISMKDSLNLSSDVIVSEDDDEDVNPEIRVCIMWGSESFRLPIRKLQKFSYLYEVLAEKYGVSVDRVVLNLKDKIINPALSPADLSVTIVDVIEGGIGSLQSCSRAQSLAPLTVTQDPDSISLRVQSSSKRGSVNISINIKDKMIVLMHKYAEEKQLKIDKLRFMFDGEQLSPRSTPSSLDLEGDECIDVYELT